jgi:hypothetical protein
MAWKLGPQPSDIARRTYRSLTRIILHAFSALFAAAFDAAAKLHY